MFKVGLSTELNELVAPLLNVIHFELPGVIDEHFFLSIFLEFL